MYNESLFVKNLSVDCLLVSHFLISHKAVIDCKNQLIYDGGGNGPTVLFSEDCVAPHPHPSPQSLLADLHTLEAPEHSPYLIHEKSAKNHLNNDSNWSVYLRRCKEL